MPRTKKVNPLKANRMMNQQKYDTIKALTLAGLSFKEIYEVTGSAKLTQRFVNESKDMAEYAVISKAYWDKHVSVTNNKQPTQGQLITEPKATPAQPKTTESADLTQILKHVTAIASQQGHIIGQLKAIEAKQDKQKDGLNALWLYLKEKYQGTTTVQPTFTTLSENVVPRRTIFGRKK